MRGARAAEKDAEVVEESRADLSRRERQVAERLPEVVRESAGDFRLSLALRVA